MAYGLKYFAEFCDNETPNDQKQYRVELLRKDYTLTATEIIDLAPEPFLLKFRGGKTQKNINIFGSEAQFNFVINEGEDYSDLFESTYKDWKLHFYEDAQLKWIGYVKPENLTQPYIDCYPYITKLSATDAVADLKDIEYPFLTGHATLLEVVKTCIQQIGLELDIKIHLNAYENTLMTTNEQIFEKVSINQRRFEQQKDGRYFNDNCYKILTEILAPFSVIFRQNEGFWTIYNFEEINSHTFLYDYQTLNLLNRSTEDLRLDITDHNFLNDGSKSKIEPLHRYNVTFKNRNLGENILINGDFELDYIGWNNATTPNNFGIYAITDAGESSKYLNVGMRPADANKNEDKFFFTDPANIVSYTPDDTCTVEWDMKLNTAEWEPDTPDEYRKIWVQLLMFQNGSALPIDNPKQLTLVGSWAHYKTRHFKVDITADYYFRMYIYTDLDDDYQIYEVRFDNFEWTAFSTEDISDITFDTHYAGYNNNPQFVKLLETDITFADSPQNNDVGNFKIGTDLTTRWNTYNNTEDKPIHNIHIAQKLRNYNVYKDYVKIDVLDPSYSINQNKVLILDNKTYTLVNYTKQYSTNILSLELIEILTPYASLFDVPAVQVHPFDYHIDETQLISVDGSDTGNIIIGGGGDGGSEISDGTISTTTTWSSNKINNELNLKPNTLQEVTTNGNTTNTGIDFKNTGLTQTWVFSVDVNGEMILNGPDDKNLHVSGDVVAFSSLTPPSTSWWDMMPIATATTLGGIKVGTGLSITTTGVLSATGDGGSGSSTWIGLTDTPSGFIANQWVGVNSNGDALTFKTPPALANHNHDQTYAIINHTHTGVYEPAFSKNSAFNKDFAGTGSSTTISRSNHTHSNYITQETDTLATVTTRGNVTTNNITVGNITAATHISTAAATYDKFRVWSSNNYTIGMNSAMTYGWLGDYAMTFTMNNDVNRGFVFRDFSDAKNDAAMSLTTTGNMMLKNVLGFAGSTNKYISRNLDNMRWTNQTGYLEFGASATNLNVAEFITSRPKFAFKKPIDITSQITFNNNYTSFLSASSSNRLRWTSDNNYYFEVRSDANNCSFFTNSADILINRPFESSSGIYKTSSSAIRLDYRVFNATKLLLTSTNHTMTGSLTVNGNITASGEVTAYSDRRLKSNIKKYEGGLDAVLKLKPKRFVKDNKKQIGLIAQDVEKVLPELVSDLYAYKALNYQQLTAVLIDAIKEQQKQIDELRDAQKS